MCNAGAWRSASGPASSPEVTALVRDISGDLVQARSELVDFARGIHPATLVSRGLAAAVDELARRSPVPVTLSVHGARPDPMIESTAWFVCSEAIANSTKHGVATAIEVDARELDGWLTLTITDDGVGGAQIGSAGGLRGLVDRVEALGGSLRVAPAEGSGTQLVARLPARRPGALGSPPGALATAPAGGTR